MNYLCGLLGLALAGALLTASIYRADAASWHGKFDSLQASYKTAAVAAETHAQAMEAKQNQALQIQSANAVFDAKVATSKANTVRAVYLKKLADLEKSKPTDLPHICANVVIPEDLRNAGPH